MRLSGATEQSLSRPPPANFLDADVEIGAAWAKWERMVEGKRRVRWLLYRHLRYDHH